MPYLTLEGLGVGSRGNGRLYIKLALLLDIEKSRFEWIRLKIQTRLVHVLIDHQNMYVSLNLVHRCPAAAKSTAQSVLPHQARVVRRVHSFIILVVTDEMLNVIIQFHPSKHLPPSGPEVFTFVGTAGVEVEADELHHPTSAQRSLDHSHEAT